MRLRVGGSGPLVVKVPGLAGGSGLYDEEVARAREAGFRVAQLDPTGDRSDDPAAHPLSWDGLAAEVVEALDRLGSDSAVLWGTSFGCLISLAVAARQGQRVRGLLLCAPPRPGWRPPFHLWLLRLTERARRPERATAAWFTAGFLLLNSWEFLNPAALVRLPGIVRAALDARTPPRTVLDKLRLLLRDDPGLPDPRRAIPCSIISGSLDTVTLPGASLQLAELLPGARLRRLAFTGHSCAYARAGTFVRWSVEELRRLSGLAPTEP